MKKNLLITFILFLAVFTASAQTGKPVAKGFITVSTGQKIQFTNLKFQDEMVVFTNTVTKSEFTYFLKTVRIIEDADKNIIYKQFENTAVPVIENGRQINIAAVEQKKAPIDKKKTELIFKNCDRAYYDGRKIEPVAIKKVLSVNPEALRLYNNGRTLNTIGDVALGTGLGVLLGRGISNLNQTDETRSSYRDTKSNKGIDGVMVAGLIISAASIPLKITGYSTVRKAIEGYNLQSGRVADSGNKYEIYAVAGGTGVSLVLKW